ncbi:hypothetical protein [Burkholderia sp. BCC1977]|uniref:DUF7079 family protein n=1 Tax=Burkholderia sp. BCC1977 TaxID=2817440 RepID=UPI002ABE35D9|nr:hypothetical protein [Burkholderia sp. BCC1977]
MADSVNTLERQNCWIAMSDVFVDNEIDYRDVAVSLMRNCPNMSLPLLREAFFEEVAPALASNGMTPAPEVWTGFDSDKVVEKISEMLVRRHRSWVYRAGNCLWCLICRWLCSEMWQKLESELRSVRHS